MQNGGGDDGAGRRIQCMRRVLFIYRSYTASDSAMADVSS
jgi:hypothetical protein